LRQIHRRLKAKAAQLRREHNERAWLAYHTAYLPRAKKPPKLSKLQVREQPRRQTPHEMLAAARQWTIFLGGKIKSRPN